MSHSWSEVDSINVFKNSSQIIVYWSNRGRHILIFYKVTRNGATTIVFIYNFLVALSFYNSFIPPLTKKIGLSSIFKNSRLYLLWKTEVFLNLKKWDIVIIVMIPGGGVVVVVTNYNTTQTKVVLGCFGLLVGLCQ